MIKLIDYNYLYNGTLIYCPHSDNNLKCTNGQFDLIMQIDSKYKRILCRNILNCNKINNIDRLLTIKNNGRSIDE